MDINELQATYRMVLNPPLFERVVSFLCRDRIDPLARDSIRATLAVLDSMTPFEREHPLLVSESHIDRIALGSGETEECVRLVISSLSKPPRKRRR
jgi:signal recognition particle GTPase